RNQYNERSALVFRDAGRCGHCDQLLRPTDDIGSHIHHSAHDTDLTAAIRIFIYSVSPGICGNVCRGREALRSDWHASWIFGDHAVVVGGMCTPWTGFRIWLALGDAFLTRYGRGRRIPRRDPRSF